VRPHTGNVPVPAIKYAIPDRIDLRIYE